ncbi:MAG: hypothetical protein C4B59_14305 [Candidatus Methanogaster sp.]|uniref:Uncharacterized protein n=1 Tax=Candidatus Methanogaster sp. TaxID=3386292 RepID=A0AC61KZG6_9EURY|nr:MAG: hypothetical protein C4B59_14305 [ANME-2 cluster archaeon]
MGNVTRMLSVLLVIALMILLFAGTAAAATPPVPYFNQCDPRWSDDRLGGDGQVICSHGLARSTSAYAFQETYGEEYLTKADLTSPIIDDFEDADVGDWSSFATQDASIDLSSSNNSKSGNHSMRIDCNLSGYETNWCGAYRQIDTWINYDNVSLWVYGDNSGNTLEIKLEEDYGEEGWVQWVYAPVINWSGWKKLEIPVPSFSAEGGANDISDDKSKVNRFTLVVSGTSPPGSTVYVDDIRLKLSDKTVSDDDFLEMLERATFEYFRNEANPANGLIRDRSTSDSPCSIAAVGFGLSAICIAESRGWINRTDASDRVLTTLETFNNLYNKEGFYYHWINMETCERERNCEVSSIDTALLMAGILHAGEHYKENESIRNLSNELYRRVNWTWMLNGTDTIAMKWTPEEGLSPDYWRGYNEAMIMYLLAIGSPTHPVPDPEGSWNAWASTYGVGCGRMIDGFEDNNVSDWAPFTNSSSGASINISPSNNSKIGDYSMKIDYNIGYNTGGEQCGVYLQKITWANYDSVNLWIYGDDSGNTLRIKLEEDSDEEHWIYELFLNWTGWKEFDIPVSSLEVWEKTRNDGILNKTKVNRFTVVILGTSASGSTIYLDDFKLPCSFSDCCDGEDFIYCWTGSLFTYQYSHCWIDFRCKHDDYANYWQNSINAVRENRLFCIDNSDVYATYNENCWGLTACDGPNGYAGYGSCPCYCHDGTIPPTGAGESVALAPDIAIPALRYMYETYGGKIWGKYGFKDAFNLDTNISLDGCQPWWTEDYIGIDEGAIILMIENYRSGLVWNEFMQNPYVMNAMDEAGFVPMIRGDLDYDCALTSADALICLQIAAGSRPCDAEMFAAADVSGDNRVTSLDALMILQAAAGRIEL